MIEKIIDEDEDLQVIEDLARQYSVDINQIDWVMPTYREDWYGDIPWD